MMKSFHGLNVANLLDSKYLLLRILVIFFWHATVLIYFIPEVPGWWHLAILLKLIAMFGSLLSASSVIDLHGMSGS